MQKIHQLVAGYATRGQGAGPLVVTEQAGFFVKHELEVKTRLMNGARGVVLGLMDGEIQFGNLAAPALLRADLADGADLVFLTGGINQQFLMGRPGVLKREQLAHGTIAIPGDGGLNDVLAYFISDQLEKDGVCGINLVTLAGGGGGKVSSLLDQKCNALIITPPEAIEAKRRGCHFLVDFADYGLNFALGGVAARQSYIQGHDAIVRKFTRAYLEGMHRYRTDRTFTVQVQQAYSGLSDRSIAEETYDITRPGMPQAPYPVPNALGIALQVMAKQLPQAVTADPLRFVEDRFIRELEESGFISSLHGA